MKIVLKWLISTIAILISAHLLPGISVLSVWTALILAVFLAIINVIIKPILILVTLPINILTLGLFTFIINAGLILFANTIIKGFEVQGFWQALLFSIVLSIISYILHKVFGTK